MLNIGASSRVYVYQGESDMRWSFERLSSLVSQVMKLDVLSGALFLFLNRRRDCLKVLYFEPSGYCIWYKRLEAGCFSKLERNEISWTELVCLIDGFEIEKISRKRRFSLRNISDQTAVV